jgi:hypothetical protein
VTVKTEAEIRAYRDALRVANGFPCDCAGGEHEEKCVTGGRMMDATIAELSWVLGEAEWHQPFVNRVVAMSLEVN